MEKFKASWRAFMNRLNDALLALLLTILYFAGFGVTRLLAAVFARQRLSMPQPGWEAAKDAPQNLETAKRQS